VVIKFAALSAARTSRDVPSVQWNVLLFESSEHESQITVMRPQQRFIRHTKMNISLGLLPSLLSENVIVIIICCESLFVLYTTLSIPVSPKNHNTG
jgi:hypothetical protein